MLICSVLLVHVALTSSLATIKENFNLRDVSNTDRSYSNATDGIGALQNLTKQDINARNLQNLQGHAPSTTIGATTNLELVNRRKRGWGAFIFTGVTTTIRLAGLGLTLAQALSEGCVYFPSICRNKEKMERIERQLVSMRSEFEKLYLENKKEYLNIATANTNNAYISYYINDTLQNMHTLENLELMLSSTLETRVPKLNEMFEAAKNFTSEEYLESVIGRLEYRLSDINNMLKKEKQNQLVGLLVQYLVEAAVSKFMDAFSQAYKEVLGHPESILEGSEMQRMLGGEIDTGNPTEDAKIKTKSKGKFKFANKVIKPLKKIRQSFKNIKKSLKSSKAFKTQIKKLGSKLWKNTKLVGKTFKQMGKNLFQSLKKVHKSISTTVKNIVDPKRRKTLKKNIFKKFNKFKLKLRTGLRNFRFKKFKSSASFYLKSKLKGLKPVENMKTSEKVMGVVGVVADIVSQVTSALGWKKTAQTVEKARINYEKYYKNFFNELNVVKKEKAQLAKSWTGVIAAFKSSSSVFRTLMNNARNYTRFNDVLGIPKLPVDTNNPMFSIKFQALDRTNTKSAQEKVIHFLKEIDNDIMTVVDKMHARKVMYEKVLKMTDDGKTVEDIFKSITEMFMFSKSKTVRAFGKDLTKQDLMCPISLLRSDLSTYDFFSLDIFRPECAVNLTVYKQNEQIASKQRNKNLMKIIVTKRLKITSKPTSLVDLTEFVKNAYFAKDDPEISSYGESLTEKDVMCVIATEFPSKQEYDFISLIPFRQDCENVDENDFKKLKKEAETLKGISLQIKSTLNTCKLYKFCPCPSIIAKMFQIPQDQVLNLIKLTAPKMETYCGSTGCSCVKLK